MASHHPKGSRVRNFFGAEGEIVEVHISPGFAIQQTAQRVGEGSVSYSVLWDDGTLSGAEHSDLMPWS